MGPKAEAAAEEHVHFVDVLREVNELLFKEMQRLRDDKVLVSKSLCDLVALSLDVGTDLGEDQIRVDHQESLR